MVSQRSLGLALLVLLVGGFAHAEDTLPDPKSPDFARNVALYVQLDLMVSLHQADTVQGVQRMRVFSADVDPYYRNLLFEKYHQDAFGAFVLNMATGGLGSVLQGDIFTGVVLTLGSTASTFLLVAAMSTNNPGQSWFGFNRTQFLPASLAVGGTVFVLGALAPYLNSAVRNARLRSALSLE